MVLRPVFPALLLGLALLAPASWSGAQEHRADATVVPAAATAAATAGVVIPDPSDAAPSAVAAPAGPRASAARAGISAAPRVNVLATDAPEPAQRQTSRERGRLLTFIGAGLFLAGIIMEGDVGTVVALSGLGVGIFGILNWLQ